MKKGKAGRSREKKWEKEIKGKEIRERTKPHFIINGVFSINPPYIVTIGSYTYLFKTPRYFFDIVFI